MEFTNGDILDATDTGTVAEVVERERGALASVVKGSRI
jgi:hypothetical protein